jgi:hypothetical protein
VLKRAIYSIGDKKTYIAVIATLIAYISYAVMERSVAAIS